MARATLSSFKTLPAPTQREPLGFFATFNHAEAEAIANGSIPKAMEDKWFICLHESWLLFHRSWTGVCVYALRLEDSPGGLQVVDSWVNRDPNQYKWTDVEYDRRLVRFLIDAFLLHRPAVFPMPPNVTAKVTQQHPGLVQHALAGRAFPESPPGQASSAKERPGEPED